MFSNYINYYTVSMLRNFLKYKEAKFINIKFQVEPTAASVLVSASPVTLEAACFLF